MEHANRDPVFMNKYCAAILDPVKAEPVGLSETATWLELSGKFRIMAGPWDIEVASDVVGTVSGGGTVGALLFIKAEVTGRAGGSPRGGGLRNSLANPTSLWHKSFELIITAVTYSCKQFLRGQNPL